MNTRNQEYDVCIIGGGITGSLLAYQFISSGFTCCIVERGQISQGSTSQSTALLQYELDVSLLDLTCKIGEDGAAFAYAETLRSLHDIRHLNNELHNSFDFKWVGSLYLADNDFDAATLHDEDLLKRRLGFLSKYLTAADLHNQYGITAKGGIESQEAAQINPIALTNSLIQYLTVKGLVVFENEEANIIPDAQSNIVATSSRIIKSSLLIIASGYKAMDYIDKKAVSIVVNRTFVVKGKSHYLKSHAHETLLWETIRPYFYLRSMGEGEYALGGGDIPINYAPRSAELLSKKTDEILKRFYTYFPDADFEVDSTLDAVFVESADSMPILYKVEAFKNCYTVLGCGGNGILFSTWAARALTEYMQGISDKSFNLLKPERLYNNAEPTRSLLALA